MAYVSVLRITLGSCAKKRPAWHSPTTEPGAGSELSRSWGAVLEEQGSSVLLWPRCHRCPALQLGAGPARASSRGGCVVTMLGAEQLMCAFRVVCPADWMLTHGWRAWGNMSYGIVSSEGNPAGRAKASLQQERSTVNGDTGKIHCKSVHLAPPTECHRRTLMHTSDFHICYWHIFQFCPVCNCTSTPECNKTSRKVTPAKPQLSGTAKRGFQWSHIV